MTKLAIALYPGMNSPKGGYYSGPVTTLDKVLITSLFIGIVIVIACVIGEVVSYLRRKP